MGAGCDNWPSPDEGSSLGRSTSSYLEGLICRPLARFQYFHFQFEFLWAPPCKKQISWRRPGSVCRFISLSQPKHLPGGTGSSRCSTVPAPIVLHQRCCFRFSVSISISVHLHLHLHLNLYLVGLLSFALSTYCFAGSLLYSLTYFFLSRDIL